MFLLFSAMELSYAVPPCEGKDHLSERFIFFIGRVGAKGGGEVVCPWQVDTKTGKMHLLNLGVL